MSRRELMSRPLALLFAAVLTLGACGGKDKDGKPIPLDQMEITMMRAYCQLAMDCETHPMLALLEGDVDACVTLMGGQGGMDRWLSMVTASVQAGNTAYDGAAARTCLDALRNAECSVLDHGSPDPACEETFMGLLANDQACTLDEACAGGWCNMETSCPGVCDVTAGLSESCVGYRPCESGLACEAGTCIVDPGPIALGESCTSSERGCAYEAFCDWEGSGNCAARRAAGQDCDGDDMCQQGLYCGPDWKCAPMVIVSIQGAPCGGYEEGPFCSVTAGLGCVMDNSEGEMAGTTCQPLRQSGDDCLEADIETEVVTMYPCDMLMDLYCDINFQARSGVCRSKKAAGELCDSDQECQSGWCDDDGRCAGVSTDPCDTYGE